MDLFAVRWVDPDRVDGPAVRLLDQTGLPVTARVVDCRDVATLAEAIRSLRVRGAPALGVAGAWGVVLGALVGTASATAGHADAIAEFLAAQRPTAVNLGWAARMVAAAGPDVAAMTAVAAAIERDNKAACVAMGRHGAALFDDGVRLLTHCNTGMLACQGIGTAFGVARTLWEDGALAHLWVDETRPLLQGARLTAYEADALGMPHTVIADAAAGSLLAAGDVDGIVVGADRIAANGDTANKVGTYPLAVLAARHDVPFYVVAPTPTIDHATPDGGGIEIELRDADEVRSFPGVGVITPAGSLAHNPAFDVTPAELITGIVTERGVARPPYAETLATLR